MPQILTIPRAQAPALPESGCWPVPNLDFLHAAVWQSRAAAEHDEAFLQPIPYLVLRNAAGQLWCYQRSGGDARLNGRCSCGVGGHVDLQDAQPPLSHNQFDSLLRTPDKGNKPISSSKPEATPAACRTLGVDSEKLPQRGQLLPNLPLLERALLRELAEELGAGAAELGQLSLCGLIYEGLSAVGRVHLGVLFSAQWLPVQPPQPVAGEALRGLGFQAPSAIADNARFELWSRLAARQLL